MNVCTYVEIYLFYLTIYLRVYTLKSPGEGSNHETGLSR